MCGFVEAIDMSATFVCAISVVVLSCDLSCANVDNDVKLIFFAIVACWMSFRVKGSKQSPINKESASVAQPDVVELDINKQMELMKTYTWERNIGGVMSTFREIKQSGASLNSLMFNTVLQAFVNCGNTQAAEDWMDEIKEAGMLDECSFNILIKALVSACTIEKANKVLMNDMKSAGVQPGVTAFNEVLGGFAREGRFQEARSLLDQMPLHGLQPTSITLNITAKLLDGLRGTVSSLQAGMRDGGTSINCGTLVPVPVPSPRLAATIARAKDAKTFASCTHEVRLSGSLPRMKAARRTLNQLGFLQKSESGGGPLDGHWETDQGFTVVIEGKIVRWSARHASKLRYTSDDRSACSLTLYGEATHGHLVPLSEAPDGTQTLRWDNGDVWYPCDGRAIGQNILFSQTMTKILRDTMQDQMYRARASAILKSVSTQALHMPCVFEDAILQFLGNDLYYISIHFESRWNPSRIDEDDELLSEASEDICASISRRHPRVGLRHCWAECGDGLCGQRTCVNGEELDERCFGRHVGAVSWT
jgi:pentatricopeptide repeat protein